LSAEGKSSSFANLEVLGYSVIEANGASRTAVTGSGLAHYGTNAVLLITVRNAGGVERRACDFVEALIFAVSSRVVRSI